MFKFINDLDRRFLETLDKVTLYIWNNFEIRWVVQQRILAVLFVALGKIPRLATRHSLDIGDWIGIAMIGLCNVILSNRSPELHNLYVSSTRDSHSFYRLVLWGLFIAIFIIDINQTFGVWLLEISNIIWVIAMFAMETYMPTKPPQKRRREVYDNLHKVRA